MDARRALISIVIPCFNQARFLPDAIDSARSAEFEVETIVVDDGSTDGAGDVAKLYPIEVVRQENSGLAAARNRGLASATAPFVIFLDADDRLLPGGIDIGVRALAAHPECAMTYGRCTMMGPDGTFWPTPEQPVVYLDHYASLLRTNRIWMPAMAIFRRDALVAAGGFRSGFDAAADYDLYLRMARRVAIHDHGQRVAAYRRHAWSMSGNVSRMLADTLAVMRANRQDAVDAEMDDEWCEGYAAWQDFYGTQLVEEIRADLRGRRYSTAARKSALVARLAPEVFQRELGRALRRRYAGRAIPAAEMASASRRAEL
jgi:glycosyltransferase involved in cell wall biosynthesis